jgi:hypothetical protein
MFNAGPAVFEGIALTGTRLPVPGLEDYLKETFRVNEIIRHWKAYTIVGSE